MRGSPRQWQVHGPWWHKPWVLIEVCPWETLGRTEVSPGLFDPPPGEASMINNTPCSDPSAETWAWMHLKWTFSLTSELPDSISIFLFSF